MAGQLHTRTYKKAIVFLIEQRRKAQMNQRDLAKVLGVPQSYVGKYETLERRLDFVEVIRICDAIECDPLAFTNVVVGEFRNERSPDSGASK